MSAYYQVTVVVDAMMLDDGSWLVCYSDGSCAVIDAVTFAATYMAVNP